MQLADENLGSLVKPFLLHDSCYHGLEAPILDESGRFLLIALVVTECGLAHTSSKMSCSSASEGKRPSERTIVPSSLRCHCAVRDAKPGIDLVGIVLIKDFESVADFHVQGRRLGVNDDWGGRRHASDRHGRRL